MLAGFCLKEFVMDCAHQVIVYPVEQFLPPDHLFVYSLEPHVQWLRENGITRYRGGSFFPYSPGDPVRFRFESKEDAMAFKMRWA